jgi:hypothetical protein
LKGLLTAKDNKIAELTLERDKLKADKKELRRKVRRLKIKVNDLGARLAEDNK